MDYRGFGSAPNSGLVVLRLLSKYACQSGFLPPVGRTNIRNCKRLLINCDLAFLGHNLKVLRSLDETITIFSSEVILQPQIRIHLVLACFQQLYCVPSEHAIFIMRYNNNSNILASCQYTQICVSL